LYHDPTKANSNPGDIRKRKRLLSNSSSTIVTISQRIPSAPFSRTTLPAKHPFWHQFSTLGTDAGLDFGSSNFNPECQWSSGMICFIISATA
jgi:hypothetical protein